MQQYIFLFAWGRTCHPGLPWLARGGFHDFRPVIRRIEEGLEKGEQVFVAGGEPGSGKTTRFIRALLDAKLHVGRRPFRTA